MRFKRRFRSFRKRFNYRVSRGGTRSLTSGYLRILGFSIPMLAVVGVALYFFVPSVKRFINNLFHKS